MTIITHKRAMEILEAHSCDPTVNMAFDIEVSPHQEVENSSFYDELGRKDEYSLRDVKMWLGY